MAACAGCLAAEKAASEPEAKSETPSTGQPKWSCAKQTVTVDPVWRGKDTLSFGYEIRNEGTADLHIKAKGGWGVRFNGQADRTIAPGATENLEITLSCSKLHGDFTKKIFVTTNDPDHPREELICKGKILDAVRYTPRLVRFMRRPDDDSQQEQTVALTRGDGGPLKLRLEPTETPGIDAKLKEIERGERYELAVTLAKGAQPERNLTVLVLQTGIPESPRLTVPVYMTIPGGRRVGPASPVPGRVQRNAQLRGKAESVATTPKTAP